jgi:hypothetical protein
MRFVQRDPASNKIIGHFANPQPYAQEELADDHPDILAYKAEREAAKILTPAQLIDKNFVRNPMFRGLIRVLAQRFNITPQQLIDAIKAQADS